MKFKLNGQCALASHKYSLLLVLFATGLVGGGELKFQAYDVGDLGCDGSSIAYDINDSGVVVGISGFDCDENGHGWSWDNGILTDLSVQSGNLDINQAQSISRAGAVQVGIEDYYYRVGFLKDGVLTKLAPPVGCEENEQGERMNSSGTIIVGSCDDDSNYYSSLPSVYWTDEGSSLAFEPPDDMVKGGNSYATDVNDDECVVGYYHHADGTLRAFIWQDGVMTKLLDTLGGDGIAARAISNSGFIVGGAATSRGTQAFRYDVNTGEMIALGDGGANNVNDRGDAVGDDIFDFIYVAAILYKDGEVIDLIPYLPSYMPEGSAHAINNYGWIVGEALDEELGFKQWGWLLVPIYAKGDFDGDEDVDLQDFGHFQRCFAAEPYIDGTLHVGCSVFDFDDDVDLDLSDYQAFQAAFTGPL